jgi:hypothetical protein
VRVGVEPGPEGASEHRSSHYVYDTRSGAIVAAHHFAGKERAREEGLVAELLNTAQEASGISAEHLAVLTMSGFPETEGAMRVADDGRGLVQVEGADLRIRP